MLMIRPNRGVLALLIVFGLLAATAGRAAESGGAGGVEPKIEGDMAWYNVPDWGVEGRGWGQTERYFDRLPAKAKGSSRSRKSAAG